LEERSHQKLFFQFSLNWRITSRLNSSNQLPVATANGESSCPFGLDSSESYRSGRGSRTKRGVRADSPAWSEPPNRNPVARVGMRKRHHRVTERRNATGRPQGGNRRAHEGATCRKRWGSLSPVRFRHF
jgi:hypothetical protein